MKTLQFAHEIGSHATIVESGGTESGRIIGRAQHENSENQYYLRYRAADGRCVEYWWAESALTT